MVRDLLLNGEVHRGDSASLAIDAVMDPGATGSQAFRVLLRVAAQGVRWVDADAHELGVAQSVVGSGE